MAGVPVVSAAGIQNQTYRRARWALVSCAMMVPATGCMTFQAPQPERFEVRSTGLDVLEIVYLAAPEAADGGGSVTRLTLFGSGMMRLREGTSPRVLDGFAADTDHPNWQDVRENRLNASMEAMTSVFQRFVDLGLVYPPRRHPRRPSEPGFPLVRVVGKIQGRPVHRILHEPELIDLVEVLIETIR